MRSHEIPAYRHCLPNVAHAGDGDQSGAANAAVGRIESDPTCAGHVNLSPRMGGPLIYRPQHLLIGIEEITGDDPRPKSEAARRFDEKDGKIPAGSPSSTQSFGRRLNALVIPALRSLSRARVSVGLPRTKARAQFRSCPAGSAYCGIVSAPRSVHSSSV